MARGRMISKAISLDEKVNSLSDDTARLLFTWLIPHLDCEGRLHGDATTIKSIVFPRRNISTRKVEKYLKEMEKIKLILRYSVDGNTYLCAPNFEKHQTGLYKNKESPSQIPPFTPELLQSEVGITQLQVKVKVKDKPPYSPPKKGEDIIPSLFDKFWEAYPKKRDKAQAKRIFGKICKKAIKDSVLLEEFVTMLLSAVEAQKKMSVWQKNGGEFIPLPSTWLYNKRWEDEVEGKEAQTVWNPRG